MNFLRELVDLGGIAQIGRRCDGRLGETQVDAHAAG